MRMLEPYANQKQDMLQGCAVVGAIVKGDVLFACSSLRDHCLHKGSQHKQRVAMEGNDVWCERTMLAQSVLLILVKVIIGIHD
jgi:hypothetical protein